MCEKGKASDVVVKKDERGGRDPKGKQKRNEKVREINKEQRQHPDPNAVK
jgi:hypothetical protein